MPTSDEIAAYVDQESTTCGDRESEIGIAGHGVTHLLPRSDKISSLHGERGAVSTEELRKAVVHYRALFDELLEVKDTKPVVTQEARMAVHS